MELREGVSFPLVALLENKAWAESILRVLLRIQNASPSALGQKLNVTEWDCLFSPSPLQRCNSAIVSSSMFYGSTKLHSSHRELVSHIQADTWDTFYWFLMKKSFPTAERTCSFVGSFLRIMNF